MFFFFFFAKRGLDLLSKMKFTGTGTKKNLAFRRGYFFFRNELWYRLTPGAYTYRFMIWRHCIRCKRRIKISSGCRGFIYLACDLRQFINKDPEIETRGV